ncbi:TetR/AcrR family transcriptional regulator [Conexibacter stalactiti]|uniref:TetR/AcrR family transcriptional regulator n=1 Tax=Conexibacter stalactiti TaxID=1940611 RepID=A0ABU4HJC6_9ACTN|nr:TetR/AcrR family transcriptional regulator [Conexibacter stalactiti]MDW5593417.1 TetR/AcrR family transcriptional regulator [Conexibacter stalactiti]MEC5034058.1 TetR/AcrR family transcriptional regulator [Conexibacter stalactiti]
MSTTAPGLRERKKARTRAAIVRATLELTLEHGFAAATIPQIAERADVAPRTVSLYFPHKEEIVFDGAAESVDRLVTHLTGGSGDLVEGLRAWLADEATRTTDDDLELLRHRAVVADRDLRMRDRQLMEAAEEKIASVVADELSESLTGIGPRTFATAMVSVLTAVRDVYVSTHDSATAEQELDRGLAFLQAGLDALRRTG